MTDARAPNRPWGQRDVLASYRDVGRRIVLLATCADRGAGIQSGTSIQDDVACGATKRDRNALPRAHATQADESARILSGAASKRSVTRDVQRQRTSIRATAADGCLISAARGSGRIAIAAQHDQAASAHIQLHVSVVNENSRTIVDTGRTADIAALHVDFIGCDVLQARAVVADERAGAASAGRAIKRCADRSTAGERQRTGQRHGLLAPSIYQRGVFGGNSAAAYLQRIRRHRLVLAANAGGAGCRPRRNVADFNSVGCTGINQNILLVACNAGAVREYRRIAAGADYAQQVRTSAVDGDILLAGRSSNAVLNNRAACAQRFDDDALAATVYAGNRERLVAGIASGGVVIDGRERGAIAYNLNILGVNGLAGIGT